MLAGSILLARAGDVSQTSYEDARESTQGRQADADITVFDLGTIVDTATFEDELSFSKGVVHVLVGGTFVVRDSQSVKDVFPGKPVLGRYRAGS